MRSGTGNKLEVHFPLRTPRSNNQVLMWQSLKLFALSDNPEQILVFILNIISTLDNLTLKIGHRRKQTYARIRLH